MTHIPKQFAVADPRTFDGNPYEVADRAVVQTAGVVALASETAADARVMARNAELERQETPDAVSWDESAEGKRWGNVLRLLEAIQKDLEVLRTVASYDPKRPARA